MFCRVIASLDSVMLHTLIEFCTLRSSLQGPAVPPSSRALGSERYRYTQFSEPDGMILTVRPDRHKISVLGSVVAERTRC